MYLRKKGQAGGSYQKKGKNRERKNVSLPSAVENVKDEEEQLGKGHFISRCFDSIFMNSKHFKNQSTYFGENFW